MKNVTRLAILASALLALAACEQQGPFEEAGEKIDESIEEVENSVEDACEDFKEEMGAEDKDC